MREIFISEANNFKIKMKLIVNGKSLIIRKLGNLEPNVFAFETNEILRFETSVKSLNLHTYISRDNWVFTNFISDLPGPY